MNHSSKKKIPNKYRLLLIAATYDVKSRGGKSGISPSPVWGYSQIVINVYRQMLLQEKVSDLRDKAEVPDPCSVMDGQ